jgi:hypothetical protein
MKARSALDRFENSFGGIVPVALLASLAIAGTLAVFHLANAQPDRQVLSILVAGNVLSRTLGLADVVEKVDEEIASVSDVRSQKDEFDRLLASSPVVYAGLFASKSHGAFHLYIDTEHRIQILIKRLKVPEAAKAVAEGMEIMAVPGELLVGMISYTEDDRVLQTQTRKARLIHPPWVEVESLSSDSDGEVLIAELRSKHLQLVGDAKLRDITVDNILDWNRTEAERESAWLMDQAPLTLPKWDALIGGILTSRATEAERGYLLVGFCDGASEEYDRMAIDAFLKQRGDDTTPIAAEGLIAVHAMTNRFHLLQTLVPVPEAKQSRAKSKLRAGWIKQAITEPVSTTAELDSMIAEITSEDPLVLLGEIEKPFPAKIYQRSSANR